jgi:DNA invertase Pin-like site-specific DNA recombinase
MIIAAYVFANKFANNETAQVRAIQKWISSNRIKPSTVQWYFDREIGIDNFRPEFAQLQRDIEAKAVGTVLIYSLNRIACSFKSGLEVLEAWCKKDVRVVSVYQSFDIKSDYENVTALIKAISTWNLEIRKERQAIGMQSARQKGRLHGRRKGAFKAGVNYKRAALLRRRGRTIKQIATALGVSASTVSRYLKHAKSLEQQRD